MCRGPGAGADAESRGVPVLSLSSRSRLADAFLLSACLHQGQWMWSACGSVVAVCFCRPQDSAHVCTHSMPKTSFHVPHAVQETSGRWKDRLLQIEAELQAAKQHNAQAALGKDLPSPTAVHFYELERRLEDMAEHQQQRETQWRSILGDAQQLYTLQVSLRVPPQPPWAGGRQLLNIWTCGGC